MNRVSIDQAHLKLIHGLVCAQKPCRILEFGFGTGATTNCILDALRFNGTKLEFSAYTVVDNWIDWGGKMPLRAKLTNGIYFCEEDESKFVREDAGRVYDFIVCDADHQKTHENWRLIYDNLLAPDGVVVFHDVTNRDFPNLWMIVTEVRHRDLPHVLFNKCSLEDENCDRGLLVVFK